MDNYAYKFVFKLNEPFDINVVNNFCKRYSKYNVLIEVQNTKGITSSLLRDLYLNADIRIAGGYDEERVNRRRKLKFRNGETGDYYYSAVIYSKNEIIKILEEIEKIESGLNKNWSDIQKLIYIYDKLKTGIMYDPYFENKISSETRSLRGLVTKKTVCAGYSLIFKEIMDRNNIDCEYVEGITNAYTYSSHAWNIVSIDGKKYPIDLTWDNSKFRAGNSFTFDWVATDVQSFSKTHHPSRFEKTQNYNETLSHIDSNIIKKLYLIMGINRARDYESTTYFGSRKDGSKYLLSQIGNNVIDDVTYYRYCYIEISEDGTKKLPLILYSETNITNFINLKNFKKDIPRYYEDAIDNILFSKENINDSLAKKTYYIGKITENEFINNVKLHLSNLELFKPIEKRILFSLPTKGFRRSDGSVFIAQQMYSIPHEIYGFKYMRYDIFEMVNDNGKYVLKRNTVFTEKNFFNDTRQSMIDVFLSRKRLDRKVNEAGGYIGYYDEKGFKVFNPVLSNFFETSKRADVNTISEIQHKR